jgi:hypothetical protein
MAGYFTCTRCGQQGYRERVQRHVNFCDGCGVVHAEERRKASVLVQRAIRHGHLPRAKECACADCGKSAHDYDHRDYTKPLEVAPVCRACNLRRGPAFDSLWRPEGEQGLDRGGVHGISLCPAEPLNTTQRI